MLSLEEFKKGASEKSASCQIIAPPGAGKTQLARSLAKAVGYNFLDFNITLMNSKDDITNMFDKIATEQVKMKHKPLTAGLATMPSALHIEVRSQNF